MAAVVAAGAGTATTGGGPPSHPPPPQGVRWDKTGRGKAEEKGARMSLESGRLSRRASLSRALSTAQHTQPYVSDSCYARVHPPLPLLLATIMVNSLRLNICDTL